MGEKNRTQEERSSSTTFEGNVQNTYDKNGELWLTIRRREATKFAEEETTLYDHQNLIIRNFDRNSRIKYKEDAQQKFIISNENLFPLSNEVVIMKHEPYRPLTFLYSVQKIDNIMNFQISRRYSGEIDGNLNDWTNLATEISLNRGFDNFAVCVERYDTETGRSFFYKLLGAKIMDERIKIEYTNEYLAGKNKYFEEELNEMIYPNYDCLKAKELLY